MRPRLTSGGLSRLLGLSKSVVSRSTTYLTGFTPEERTELMGFLLRMYRNLKPSTSQE